MKRIWKLPRLALKLGLLATAIGAGLLANANADLTPAQITPGTFKQPPPIKSGSINEPSNVNVSGVSVNNGSPVTTTGMRVHPQVFGEHHRLIVRLRRRIYRLRLLLHEARDGHE